jgi:aminomuconate-semialdehyde/2-hydroxymuconate-6-semialdehyde dehydrogenase
MGPDKYIKNYIEGILVPADSGAYLDNFNPSTGRVYSYFPDSSEKDVVRAVAAARKAFPGWASLEPQRRFRLLMRIADIIEQDLHIFAEAEARDTGKPASLARSVDIPRSQANFRFFAAAILHEQTQAYHQPGSAIHYAMRQPIGVVGCITPWNLPLYLLTSKVAPALAAGNCVVAKTSELTPVTAHMLSKACVEAGLPQGVLNIVHGVWEQVAVPIMEHPEIGALTFIGDNIHGRIVAECAAKSFKKLSLALGGKNPNIIFEDCDFNQMMVGTLRSSFTNNGQINFSGSRIYVERPLYERFREQLVKRTQFLKVGDPFSAVTDLGALISREHLEQVLSYLALAEVEGGKILCGGTPIEMNGEFENGFFLRPAIIEGLPLESRTNQEEIFGPVVTIAPFDREEEVIELANGTGFALSASIWTRDIAKANRLTEQLRAGMIWINSWMVQDLRPSIERRNLSGTHWEGGLKELEFFYDTKNICVKF